ncbi:class I SAM-dependent methyltransferase [Marinobacterium sp. AK62]|uniref:Class I SAM-dependent methyltransferase n=1 Tax=Marinobacterium alkalitolerans TaxID=1542925 RepID=A0ABS3ZDI1_9GAMM|nr:methyltransferase [Marinobacterium alkalitolerans]MBP0049760.1 class I SAM-dependent methyltransferase [Marinobacterium alkalitolerans]
MDLLSGELNARLKAASGPTLWLVDENIQLSSAPNAAVTVVGNRFDVIERLEQQGWQARFGDFELSDFANEQFDCILYRVSKEKPVVHYLIQEARRLLAPQGCLVLLGDKGEGIRTYARKAASCLGGERQEQKLGKDSWCAHITPGPRAGDCPEHQNYPELRPACEDDTRVYWSKPGLFGWNKVDRGSAFLIERLPEMLGQSLPLAGRMLDLGAGFGYLSLNAAGPDTRLTCTDNNAAALLACRFNLQQAGLEGRVVAADAADRVEGPFDVILCNPPFHSGFAVDGDLTDRFLSAAARLLDRNGTACFVVNQHIPLERKAAPLFKDIQLHADNGHFKLVRLRQPIHP